MRNLCRQLLPCVILALGSLLPLTAAALPFNSLVVFGDSLSDTGNNAFVWDNVIGPPTRTPVPIATPVFIPTQPYDSERYSNGPVWVEQLASSLGVSATASLLGGTNFAFGGARTGPAGSSFPFSLVDQVATFLGATGGVAPSNALYVVVGGGNDARDAFVSGNPAPFISVYADSISQILGQLSSAGADSFLVANVPDIGKLPAVQALGPVFAGLATQVSAGFNSALDDVLAALPSSVRDDIQVLDLFGLLGDLFADPAAFGFDDATSACAFSPACIADPAGTLFWDGIHPTTEGHTAISRFALAAIPEPGTMLLMALGLVGLGFRSRARLHA